jgi:oligosaccharide repeat unit polymerase
MSVWAVSSIFSLIFYLLDPVRHPNITLIPYLFLQVCFFISIYPIRKFKNESINKIKVTSPLLLVYFCVFLSIISILPFFENVIHFFSVYIDESGVGLVGIYEDKMDNTIDKHKMITWFSPVGKICHNFVGSFSPLSIFLLFYFFTKPRINKWLLMGLTVSSIEPVLYSLNMSGRGGCTFFIFKAIFLYFLFYEKFSVNARKIIMLSGVGLILLLIIPLIILSQTRFENSSSTGFYITSLYLGEGTVNFSNLMWNDIREYTQGDNSFCYFKSILGFDTFKDYLDRRDFWNESKLGIPVHIFYTYIGDWFMDFGAIGTLMLTIFLSLIVWKIISIKNKISLLGLYIFYVYSSVIFEGFTIYPLLNYYIAKHILRGAIVLYVVSYFNIEPKNG